MLEEFVASHGLSSRLASIRTVAPTGADIARNPKAAMALLAKGCSACVREDGAGRRGREVVGDRLHVRRLPALDFLDDDEPRAAAEQAERVARSDRLFARPLACVQDLGRVRSHPLP